MHKTRLIHEVHDLWPLTLIEVGGMSRHNPFVWIMQRAENSAYRHSDRVVSLAPNARTYMMKHGLKKEAFAYITNGVVRYDWEHPQPIPDQHGAVLKALREKGKFIVGYFGGHALSNALDILMDTAALIKADQVHFVLVGDGVEKKQLVKRAKVEEIANVTFLDPISKLSIPSLVDYFDCCYIGVKDSPLYRYGIAMNKIFDTMMAGKPMLYAVNAPNNFVKKYHCGISVEAGNAASIAKGIQILKNKSEAERKQMGENGRRAVLENYEYSVLAKKFLELME